jgi:hypothetical protein
MLMDCFFYPTPTAFNLQPKALTKVSEPRIARILSEIPRDKSLLICVIRSKNTEYSNLGSLY